MSSAVIDDTALGGNRNLALLLVFGLLYKAAVAENLQVNQPSADRHAPEHEHCAQQVEPGILAEVGVSRHVAVLDKHGGPPCRRTAKKVYVGTAATGCPPSAARHFCAAISTAPPAPSPAPHSPSPVHSNLRTHYPCESPAPVPAAPAPSGAPSRRFVRDRATMHLPSAAPGSS